MNWQSRYTAGFVVLVLAVVLAGCTGPPQDNSTEPNNTATNTGTVVQRAALQDTTIFAGGTTSFVLEAQNSRKHPLRRFHVEVGNRGPLQFRREIPSQGAGQQHECRYGEIPAAEEPVIRRCVWTIRADPGIVGAARDTVTYPMTAFISYTTQVAPRQGSLDIAFEPRDQINPFDQRNDTVTARNADATLQVTSQSPRTAEQGRVPLTITVRNTGYGSFTERVGGEQEVTVSFQGTLADAAWDMRASTCDDSSQKQTTVRFQQYASTATVSCVIVLDEPALAGKTFFLRPTLTYRYQVTRNAPLQVARDE